MKTLIIDKLPRIIKNKARLEKALKVKISNKGKEVTIDGEAEDEYLAEQVLDAINFGFPYAAAISIIEEETLFEIINIKDHTNKNDLEKIRARIIGKGGKTIKTLSEISECFIELKDNQVGIIGHPENIPAIQTAMISLIKGSKQANVYAYLEKHRPLPILDLGLKEVNKKRDS